MPEKLIIQTRTGNTQKYLAPVVDACQSPETALLSSLCRVRLPIIQSLAHENETEKMFTAKLELKVEEPFFKNRASSR
ncbi:hypothetical protein TNCT_707421 [Trichonephila clavata]|uniref:Uncharacterized protein n=1 Tax=Trichonephila clavata TaxID=2740835 RepID=A0A8X6FCX4_TRICU|nr:hypothetical protein TNCT_707421 [Trichonephila clavata]